MNKEDYLKELKKSLSFLPSNEREDILYDYEEHFQFGLEEGKTEEEIIRLLGSPNNIARQYKASYAISAAEDKASASNVFRALLAIISLGFFNLIFVLGPFLACVGVLIGFFAASIGIVIGGAGLFLGVVFEPAFSQYITLPAAMEANIAATVLLSVGLTSLGILFFIGNCYLTKFFSILTVKYLKFNLKIIKK